MSVKEYALKFTFFSKYAPSIVSIQRDKMNRFLLGLSDMVAKECRMEMLVGNMDISILLIHTEQMEDEKLKEEKAREKKRSRMDGDKSFHDGSNGHGHNGPTLAGIIPPHLLARDQCVELRDSNSHFTTHFQPMTLRNYPFTLRSVSGVLLA
uniref:Gag-pol polyprotein n=1 Tax=Solanum tuberosum TaxID=4113 RepID=M1DR42_SOLTU